MSTELEAIAADPATSKDLAKDAKAAASTVQGLAKNDKGEIKPVETPPKETHKPKT
jgi:hypothetical protein